MKLEKKDQPYIFGHRGASGYCPENTLLSFQKAIDQQADGVELDVQLTSDGEVVVIHDETIDRTSNGKGFVKDYTFEQLRQFNFNNGMEEFGFVQIPTLQEVFDVIKPSSLMINIEFKTNIIEYPGIVEKVMKMVEENGMKDRILYSSFNHYTCVEVRDADKEAYVGFLYEDGFIDVPEYVRAHGGNALHPASYLLLNPLYMKKAGDLDVNVWTVNEPMHIALAKKLKVTTIITNYPDRARKIISQ